MCWNPFFGDHTAGKFWRMLCSSACDAAHVERVGMEIVQNKKMAVNLACIGSGNGISCKESEHVRPKTKGEIKLEVLRK